MAKGGVAGLELAGAFWRIAAGLELIGIVEGGSATRLELSTCNRVRCGFWHRLHRCTDLHCFTKWLDEKQFIHLDTVEIGHMRTPNTCSRSQASSFPGFRKAGRGPGNEATHPLHSVQCGRLGTRLPFDRTNAPTQAWWGQSLHEVVHLLYEAGQKLVSK